MSEFKKVTIFGGGQIGTSIVAALRQSDHNVHINVIDEIENGPSKEEFYGALTNKGISTDNIYFAYSGVHAATSDLIILATPISQFESVVRDSGRYFTGAIVTDVGSVKEESIKAIRRSLPKGIPYVPAHPFNGNAGSGPATADPALFQGKPVFLVKPVFSVLGIADQAAFDRVSRFYESFGAKIVPIDAACHDEIVGTMSHLEHVLMFSLIRFNNFRHGPTADSPDIGGWVHGPRGMTRIADAGREMWRAIFEDNRDNILRSAQAFQKNLADTMCVIKPIFQFSGLFGSGNHRLVIDAMVDSVHAYAREVRGDRGGQPVDQVEYKAKGNLIHSALGALVSVAIAQNLLRVEVETGIPLASIANPSLKDGLGPIGIDPEAVKSLFKEYGPQLRPMVRGLIRQMNVLITAIKKGNWNAVENIIEDAREIRLAILAGAQHPNFAPEVKQRITAKL